MSGENPKPQNSDASQAEVDAALAAARAGQTPPADPPPAPAAGSETPATAPAQSPAPAASQETEPAAQADSATPASQAESGGPSSASAPAGPAPDAPAEPAMPVKTLDLPDFGKVAANASTHGIDLLSDVELNVKIELGRASMLIEDVLKLGEGSVVELDKLAGDPVDVLVNDRLVARGEVIVLNENFCVRISEILAGEDESAAA